MMFSWRHLCGVLFALLLNSQSAIAADGTTCFLSVESDDCLSSGDPVATCESLLESRRDALPVRLSLCEALLRNGEFSRAAVVVDGALVSCGHDQRLCDALRVARSNVEEQLRRSAAEDPNAAERAATVLRRYCMGRIPSEGSVDACAQLLAADLSDMEVVASLGSKLIALGRPTEALRRYRRVEASLGSSQALAELIEQAQASRSELVTGCLEGGRVEDCDSALLPGEEDALSLYRQRATLLTRAGRVSAAALDLEEAMRISGNRSRTAREVLAILPNTTRAPSALRVRGDAYVVLRDDRSALGSYQAALAANPDDDSARLGLEDVLTRRQQRIQQACVEAQDRDGCQDLLVAGAPDETVIEQLLAELVSPVGPDPSVWEPDPPEPDGDPEAEADDSVVVVAAIVHLNHISQDGRTH